MPFWGLVISSVGFVIPTIIAFKRKHLVTSVSCGIITLTSLAYHGTVHPIAKTIDMAFAHIIGTGWTVESIRRAIFVRRLVDTITCTMTIGSIGIYVFKSHNNFTKSSQLWHMAFHGLSQGAWCLYLLC